MKRLKFAHQQKAAGGSSESILSGRGIFDISFGGLQNNSEVVKSSVETSAFKKFTLNLLPKIQLSPIVSCVFFKECNQLMVTVLVGLGPGGLDIKGSHYERDSYLRVPDSNPKPTAPQTNNYCNH